MFLQVSGGSIGGQIFGDQRTELGGVSWALFNYFIFNIVQNASCFMHLSPWWQSEFFVG